MRAYESRVAFELENICKGIEGLMEIERAKVNIYDFLYLLRKYYFLIYQVGYFNFHLSRCTS